MCVYVWCGGGIVVPGRKGEVLDPFVSFCSSTIRGTSAGALLFKCSQTTAYKSEVNIVHSLKRNPSVCACPTK